MHNPSNRPSFRVEPLNDIAYAKTARHISQIKWNDHHRQQLFFSAKASHTHKNIPDMKFYIIFKVTKLLLLRPK